MLAINMNNINEIQTYLKAQTRQLHQKVDTHPLMSRLMRRDLSLLQYSESLTVLKTWYKYSEAALHQQAIIKEHFSYIEKKSPLIEKDLKNISAQGVQYALREPLKSSNNRLHNPFNQLKKQNSFALSAEFYLGFLYVIEGSTMGGMMLSPRIASQFGREDITHFYDCYGAEKSTLFKRTMNTIEQHCRQKYFSENATFPNDKVPIPRFLQELTAGATYAFESLLSDLDEHLMVSERVRAKIEQFG